jgi:exodeoxyribonuclease VII large subunit
VASLFDLPFEDAPSPEPLDPVESPTPEPARPAAEPPAPPVAPRRQRRAYTVTEIATAIRNQLEEAFFEIWIEGEISNCKQWQSTGHLYFTLKDEGAQLKAVIFRSSLRFLRFKPADGQHVIVRGRVTIYEARGECQIVCEHVEPKGLGALQLAFEQLKRRLEAEGLFAPERKRPLPLLPRTIGIVTSLDGAAIRDIIKVVTARHASLRLLIRPCRVQGEGAGAEISQAIRQISRRADVDVLIVARGGGSLEDLWGFNEEGVARAIAASPIPVISGVGHEVDFTIADFVADVRAATPSNAAEIVVARKDDLTRRVEHLEHRAQALVRHALGRRRALVHQLAARRGLATVQTRVGNRARRVAETAFRLRNALDTHLGGIARLLRGLERRLESRDQRRRLAAARARLVAADANVIRHARAAVHRAEIRVRTLAGRLDTLSPLAVLGRGYAVCFADDGATVIHDAETVRVGDSVRVRLARGRLACEVTATDAPEATDASPADLSADRPKPSER